MLFSQFWDNQDLVNLLQQQQKYEGCLMLTMLSRVGFEIRVVLIDFSYGTGHQQTYREKMGTIYNPEDVLVTTLPTRIQWNKSDCSMFGCRWTQPYFWMTPRGRTRYYTKQRSAMAFQCEVSSTDGCCPYFKSNLHITSSQVSQTKQTSFF